MSPGPLAAPAQRPRPGGKPNRAHFGPVTVTALIGSLLVVEAIWFVWFLFEPLPNAANVGGAVRRWMFLGRALPGVIPGVRLDESYLGLALKELSHVENLPQRLPIVAAAGLIAAAALALGGMILRAIRLSPSLSTAERIPLAYLVGTSGLGVATLLVGRLGLIGPWPVRLGLLALTFAGGLRLLRDRATSGELEDTVPPQAGKKPGRFPWLAAAGFSAVAGPFLLMMALGAMLPTIDYDAIEYHLQGPKEYFQAGRIGFLPHNVYTSMPFGIEMLHLLGMEVLNDAWAGALAGQLMIAGFAPAAAALVALTARRWGSPLAGWCAAAVYLTTPWVYRLGVLPYVEGPLCAYHAALVWAAARAWTELDARTRTRYWGLAGLLAGGAMACKYPALVSAVVPFGLLALADSVRRRSAAALIVFSLGWAVVMTPWLGKNVADTGNPVYPLGYRVFGGRHWDPALDAKWANIHGPREVRSDLLRDSVVDVAGRSDWQSPLYVALAPLAVFRPRSRRFATALAGYAAYLFLTWWFLTHRLDRFWLPILPTLAVLAGLGADWSRRLDWRVLLAGMFGLAFVTNLAYSSTALTGLNEWTGDLTVLRRSVPQLLNPPLARLDALLPPGAKVLLVGQAAVFHIEHPIVYNTVFNHERFETLARDKPPDAVREGLNRLGVGYVYVDWHEIERYRSPGNYGFTDFVTPDVLDALVRADVLERPVSIGSKQELYRVRPSSER